MHSDKKRCADTLSLSRQAEQNRAEERVSIDTKKGSKYNKSNEKRGGGIQLKKRKWKFRIAGGAVTLLGIYLMAVGYGETITLTIATVVLIFGIAIWSMATPESYNSMTDMIAMISMEKPRKIEEFYEAYKNVDTPFGSAWLAKFYTMRQKALVFGPDAKGEYLYFWLTKDGHVGYLGYSFIEGFIKKKHSVKLNGTMIGAIVDNMDLTVGNIMFDNAFLIVYDAKYLPQLTALAVMAARELARDKDGGLSNRS